MDTRNKPNTIVLNNKTYTDLLSKRLSGELTDKDISNQNNLNQILSL